MKYSDHTNYCGSVFSFGAGTQSTAILLLIKHEPQTLLDIIGHLPEHIIFADTGAESADSLRNYERCRQLLPIYRVKNWQRHAMNNYSDIPVYFTGGGKMQRQCTSVWKIRPVHRAIRKLYPMKSPKTKVACWLGISCDEAQRMKVSAVKSIENVYPLIELGLTRQDCYAILRRYEWEAVKSCCYMCPYQVHRWADNPELDKAIAYEKELQKRSLYREVPYLHPSAIPLEEAVEVQMAQTNLFTFADECDGVCDV